MEGFQRCYEDALAAPFSGWDFSALEGRWETAPLPWDYRALVLERLPTTRALLDVGTGGGELLSSLAPLPRLTCATEAYRPNVPVARARLGPLGVHVVAVPADGRLPLGASTFDLVTDRHEQLDAAELRRVLAPGGLLVTQQVGGRDNVELNHALGDSSRDAAAFELAAMVRELSAAGLEILRAEEAHPPSRFADVGAVVYYLRAIPWQIPGFDLRSAGARDRLRELDRRMQREGGLRTRQHRFLIVCRRP